MCCECKLACLNWCCQLMNSCPASMVNCFNVGKLLTVYHYSHKNHPKWSLSHSCWNSLTFAADCSFQQHGAPAHRDCKMVEFLDCERLDFKPPCCFILTWWTFFISKPDLVHHQSSVATDSTSWDKQACTQDTLWRHHYVTTSKEYLINCHTLLKYFELVFLWLQLVKILCKLIIIWVNYERKKTPCMLLNFHSDVTVA